MGRYTYCSLAQLIPLRNGCEYEIRGVGGYMRRFQTPRLFQIGERGWDTFSGLLKIFII